MKTKRYWLFLFFINCLLINSCGGGGGGGEDTITPEQPEITVDLSGTWSGIWTGNDPIEGDVLGRWEANVTQIDTDVSGSVLLTGDVDCPEGDIKGSVSEINLILGTVDRFPCQLNEWDLKAVNIDERSASGSWTQPDTGAFGTFTGTQISTPNGPQIGFVYPPGGKTGSLITIVGKRFSSTADNNIFFNKTRAVVLNVENSEKILTAVPANSSDGPVTLETTQGLAFSPLNFISNVTSPAQFISKEIGIGRSQTSVAFSPDGRRLYYSTNHDSPSLGGLMMLDSTTLEIISETAVSTTTNVTLQGLAVSPDGRKVYVSCDDYGLCVYDAINTSLITTIPIEAGRPDKLNPQGVNLSPDGRLLFVSNNNDGGEATILTTNTLEVIKTIALGPEYTPQGIVANPDGQFVYFTFSAPSGENGQVVVYDTEINQSISSIEVGMGPIGAYVTPDGDYLYISNELENSIDLINTLNNQVIATIPVNSGPTGLAISPDGEFLFVACRLSNVIDIIPIGIDLVTNSIPVYPEPLHIGFSPDGKKAYVTHATFGLSEEIGGQMKLLIAKSGSGIGTVSSSPGSIECGSSCQESFDKNTIVSLTATPDSGSFFERWDGDPDCMDGVVTMDMNKYCVAVFNVIATDPSNGTQVYGGSGSGCFIATASFGSYLDPHVQTLREFRDKYLTNNILGRKFIDIYYEYSPPIATYISKHDVLKITTRVALTPIVYFIRYPLLSLLFSFILIILVSKIILNKQKLKTRLNAES
jgi:YVTN family beta-propeller protein